MSRSGSERWGPEVVVRLGLGLRVSSEVKKSDGQNSLWVCGGVVEVWWKCPSIPAHPLDPKMERACPPAGGCLAAFDLCLPESTSKKRTMWGHQIQHYYEAEAQVIVHMTPFPFFHTTVTKGYYQAYKTRPPIHDHPTQVATCAAKIPPASPHRLSTPR